MRSRVNIIGEIGINHNGNLNVAKKLIDVCVFAGIDYVKFQKREPDICVPEHQKNKLKQTPWGEITYLEYKKHIEFSYDQYCEIDSYCKSKGIRWFASVWDQPSCDFMAGFVDIAKIPSALITNTELIKYARSKFNYLIMSTGMSSEQDIETAVNKCNPNAIFHTNSCYPSKIEELELRQIEHLKNKYLSKEIGYSCHYYGIVPAIVSVALGATWIEKHITLDQQAFGSDQKSSVSPVGIIKLVKGIRDIEKALGTNGERILYDSELEKRSTLRG